MGILIRIALVVCTSVGALVAFFGETVKKDEDAAPEKRGLLQRVTPVGWTALACLVVALGLEVANEIITYREARAAEATALEIQKSLETNVNELKESFKDLAAAESEKDRLRDELSDTRKRLIAVLEKQSESTPTRTRQNVAQGTVTLTGSTVALPTLRGATVTMKSGDLLHYEVIDNRRPTTTFQRVPSIRYENRRVLSSKLRVPNVTMKKKRVTQRPPPLELTLECGPIRFPLARKGKIPLTADDPNKTWPIKLLNPARSKNVTIKYRLER